jgi:hypothetical protein
MAMSSKASSSPSVVRSDRVPMRLARVAAGAIAMVLALAACKNVLNDDEESFHSRFVNLIENAATVQYKVDTTIVSSSTYQVATGLNAARPGSHTISFQALRPSSLDTNDEDDPIEIGGSFDRSFSANNDYAIVAYGTLDDVKTLVFESPSDPEDVEEEFIEITVINAEANLASVEAFITAPDARINSPQSLGVVASGGRTAARTMQLYQRDDVTDDEAALFTDVTIELRDPATGAKLFKSSEFRVNEQTRILLAITPNKGPGPSQLQLMGLDGVSGTFTDVDDKAAVRVVHVSTDTPPLDIIRGSSLNTPLAENLAFRASSDYVLVPTGDVDLIATPADATSVVFLFLEEFAAGIGQSYSAYAIGPLATVDAQIIQDDRRSVPTQAKFRFLNASPSLDVSEEDGLDIYVTLPGQTLDFDPDDDDVTSDDSVGFRRASAWKFQSLSDYITYNGKTFQVRFMATGTSRVILDTTIAVTNGTVQTFVLIDSEEGELELMPVDEAL